MASVDEKIRKEKDFRRVYAILIETAESRSTIEYGEIAAELGRSLGNAFSNWIGRVLCAISEDELACGRPLLSSVAVSKRTGIPNAGFFEYAAGAGLKPGESDGERRVFWTKELNRTYHTWRDLQRFIADDEKRRSPGRGPASFYSLILYLLFTSRLAAARPPSGPTSRRRAACPRTPGPCGRSRTPRWRTCRR